MTAARGEWEGDNGGKKAKGPVKKHVRMSHGHGTTVWGGTVGEGDGLGGGGTGGKTGTTIIQYSKNLKSKRIKIYTYLYNSEPAEKLI